LNERNLSGKLDRLELRLNGRKLEFAFHRIDNPSAEVHRKPDRLLIVVEVRKRDRNVPVPEPDFAAVLDFGQRSAGRLCVGGDSDRGRQDQ
jgi:hypothetical protein